MIAIGRFILYCACAVGLGLPDRAMASEYRLEVTAVALGARVFSVSVAADLDKTSYLVEAVVKTAGVVETLARGEGLYRAMGSIDANGVNPARMLTRSSSSSGERRAELVWDSFGLALIDVRPTPQEENRDAVPPELVRGTMDLTSAVLERLLVDTGSDPCGGTMRVFDGRRRYDLHFHWGRDDILKPHRFSAYAGPARLCHARLQRIAGYQRDFEARSQGQPDAVYSVWVVKAPDDKATLPVRLRSETWFGSFTAYLSRATIDGKPIYGPPPNR